MSSAASFFEIPYYHDYLSPKLARELLVQSREVPGVPGLRQVGAGGGLETEEALRFLVALYLDTKTELARVLRNRASDRKFIDERTRACATLNDDLGREITDPEYRTVLGLEDGQGRVVFGPLSKQYCHPGGKPVAPLPDYLQGPHVTLFGPPDSAKMAVNAMNAYHRKLPNEPAIVGRLLGESKTAPMWGADDEDSKTPLRADLVDAGVNLTACFENTIGFAEGEKQYALAADHLALPIKRFPGLALPCSFLFHGNDPIPLHLYDFALHLFRNRRNPRALVFYVPKLENEEEARYIHAMIAAAEKRIQSLEPAYRPGTVRLMIVLENPRAILRAHEIMDALHPYFAGASLGWHDYLASTARLFREDHHYRIPVKADPNIVIKYIKASHDLLAQAVGSRGGIKVGGMYGILPLSGNAESMQVTLKGYFKDVITQMKRDLTGFWVAHPDFVRIGIAVVEAWKKRASGDPKPLEELVSAFLNPEFAREVQAFIDGPDIEGLDRDHPNYVRSLIVADIRESDFIPNHHPDEIRYNVFQSLQYLADWLSGNGCVALPTAIGGTPVRVMDDLATAERSRWEVWAELRHGRFAVEDFVQIAHEEMNFIRRDLSNEKKVVQVKWDERTAKWYPIAMELMLKLMTDENPVEFATELLLPFTVESVRNDPDPWERIQAVDPGKYALSEKVRDFHRAFEVCGVKRFAREMAARPVLDLEHARALIESFAVPEILEAASFHGDIGQSKRTLDAVAAREQSGVTEDEALKIELRRLGEEYRMKFGFKFLISAQGKTGSEMLEALRSRLKRTQAEEERAAREALWEISRKRLAHRDSNALRDLESLRKSRGVTGASIAISRGGHVQTLVLGEAVKNARPVTSETRFEIASLSKTFASAFALEYFREKKIPLTASVNSLFAKAGSKFRVESERDPDWGDRVTVEHLMNHTALNLHYVKGFPAPGKIPPLSGILEGGHGYERAQVLHEPGTKFQYSGGGYLVLEHLIETLEGRSIQEVTRPFFERLGIADLGFSYPASDEAAHGYFDSGESVPGTRLDFPAFAAGMLAPARAVAEFFDRFTRAFHSLDGVPGLSHDTAVQMAHGFDRGCVEFMGCRMGLGVFIAEAGENRIALHQGANEGFRAIYLHCYAGPDTGKGIVILANGDNAAVPFIAEAANRLLRELEVRGIDFESRSREFHARGIAQEQIVNQGYKTLLIDAFEPDLPPAIGEEGPKDPLADRNLAVGAQILSVTNQKFARAENLISDRLPIFDPELFCSQGKVMDSWETARHNPMESDRLELRLKKPSPVRYVAFSTEYHDGNHPESVRLEARGPDGEWFTLVPKTKLEGHSSLKLALPLSETEIRDVRVEIFPDGGLSRLGLYAELPEEIAREFTREGARARFALTIPKTHKPLAIPYAEPAALRAENAKRALGAPRADWASRALGGEVVKATNEHYGPAAQVISPYPAIHMFDGLESARSRKPGHFEEVTLKLGRPTRIAAIEFDFGFFVNNNPVAVAVDVEGKHGDQWIALVAKSPVKAFAGNRRRFELDADVLPGAIQELRVRTYPDGGVNRIKVIGSGAAV